jgi:hypothetical protein
MPSIEASGPPSALASTPLATPLTDGATSTVTGADGAPAEPPAPSVPEPPDTPSPPSTPPPVHPPAPEHPFLPGDPTPPVTPAPPPAVPDAPFVPGDPTPAPTPPAPSPPQGPTPPSASAVTERVPADHFGGRIVAEPVPEPVATTSLEGLMRRIDRLMTRQPDPAAQREIAALVALFPRLERPQNAPLVSIAELAVTALAQDPPQMELAAELRRAIRATTRGWDNLFRRIRFTTPSMRVLLGLAAFLFVILPPILLAVEALVAGAVQKELHPQQIVMVGIAGAVGSIISIMVRIQDFDRGSTPDPASQVFIGAFRPVIGIGFALFGYLVVKAGILPIGVPAEQAPYFFASLAFICGFSERLANDLVAKSEQTLSDAIRGDAPQRPAITPASSTPTTPPPPGSEANGSQG